MKDDRLALGFLLGITAATIAGWLDTILTRTLTGG